MRKLLLASVAALGVSMAMASYADAQVASDTDGQSFPTPGTITVRLNGRYRFYAYASDNGAARTSNYGVTGPNGTTTSTGAAIGATASGGSTGGTGGTGTLTQGSNRLDNYGFAGYARLYPGFDGVAANGLKYGASLEIRQDNPNVAGGGVAGSISGQSRSRGALYLRREWGYIGTDRLGTLRFGSADQPTSLYLVGTGETFDDGGLNGDTPAFITSDPYNYPFADVGNFYTTNKIVYLSPQFYGVDFGLSFEPNTGNVGDAGASDGCSGTTAQGSAYALTTGPGTAAPGCDQLASTSTGDITRRKDTYEGLTRYRGTFGPIGVVGTAAYIGSGRVHDSGVVGSTTDPKRAKLEDLSIGDFGLAVTYGGLTVGGHYELGRYNVPGGGGPTGLITHGQPNSNAYAVTAQYTIGPVVAGVVFSESWYQGNQTAATNRNANGISVLTAPGAITGGQRRDTGFAFGATYSLAPGVALYLSGIWEEARQHGVNLVTGGVNAGTVGSDVHNKLDQSTVALGTSFAW